MAWEILAGGVIDDWWKYTPPTEAEYFRLQQSNLPETGRFFVAQIEPPTEEGGDVALYETRLFLPRLQKEVFRFVKPPVFDLRSIGFRFHSATGEASDWQIIVEHWI